MFQTRVVDGMLVIHKAIAAITVESVVQAIRRWFDHHRFDASLPVLWDCRDQFIHASLADLATIHERLTEYRPRQRNRQNRTAVLVSNMTSAAALSVVEDNRYLGPDIRVFQEPEEAHAWLGVHARDVDGDETSDDTPCASA